MKIEIKRFLDLGGRFRSNALLLNKVQTMTNNQKVVAVSDLFWQLLVDTYYLKDEAYDVLVKLDSYAEIEARYGTKKSYIRNIVYREKLRLSDEIGVDIYLDLILYNTKTDKELDNLIDILNNSISKVEKRVQNGHLNKLNISMDEYVAHRNNSLSNETFAKMVTVLKPISKEYMKPFITNSDLGYLKYLLTEEDDYLNEKDYERKKYLLQEWWLNGD